jgi:sortase A
LARITAPNLRFEQVVLAQADEKVSAFALGHLDSSALPGEIGNSILRVHRDTFFDFLRLLKDGDPLVLESSRSGRWFYRISGIFIVDKANVRLLGPSLNRRLTFVSCYPCTDPDRDHLRYVVVAEEVEKIVLSQ